MRVVALFEGRDGRVVGFVLGGRAQTMEVVVHLAEVAVYVAGAVEGVVHAFVLHFERLVEECGLCG